MVKVSRLAAVWQNVGWSSETSNLASERARVCHLDTVRALVTEIEAKAQTSLTNRKPMDEGSFSRTHTQDLKNRKPIGGE